MTTEPTPNRDGQYGAALAAPIVVQVLAHLVLAAVLSFTMASEEGRRYWPMFHALFPVMEWAPVPFPFNALAVLALVLRAVYSLVAAIVIPEDRTRYLAWFHGTFAASWLWVTLACRFGRYVGP